MGGLVELLLRLVQCRCFVVMLALKALMLLNSTLPLLGLLL